MLARIVRHPDNAVEIQRPMNVREKFSATIVRGRRPFASYWRSDAALFNAQQNETDPAAEKRACRRRGLLQG